MQWEKTGKVISTLKSIQIQKKLGVVPVSQKDEKKTVSDKRDFWEETEFLKITTEMCSLFLCLASMSNYIDIILQLHNQCLNRIQWSAKKEWRIN